jgi:adenylate cyclase
MMGFSPLLKKIIVVLVIVLSSVAYVFVPREYVPAVLQRVEFLAYDMRMQLATSASFAEPRLVVVDLDEKTLDAVGRWPWPRDDFARLMTTLKEYYQVTEVGLDVFFVDKVCRGEGDRKLSESFQQYLPVLALSLLFDNDKVSGEAGKGVDLQWASGLPPKKPWWGVAKGYVGNLATFVTPESVSGHVTPTYDEGGAVRRLSPIFQLKGHFYDTLSLAVARQSFGLESLYWDDRLESWLDSPKLRFGSADSPMYMPVNERGEVLIPYNHPGQTTAYQRISAIDVLNKSTPVDALSGRLVLVGSSATSVGDEVATPLAKSLPGVEVHATLLGALLASSEAGGQQQFKVQPSNEKWLQLVLLVVMSAGLLFARHFAVWGAVLAAPLLLGVWAVGNFLLWSRFNIAVEFLPPALLLVVLMAYLIITDLLDINARHQHVRKMFGYYLPEAVVQRLANDRTGTDWLKPERRDMTVLFADIHDFTGMAESLTPEEVAGITYELFSGLTDVIHQHNGTVDKYMGDAVMAFWGAPLPDSDHALHAVTAARAMQDAVVRMNKQVFSSKNITIRLGIGINTGAMVVGNLGSIQRHAYTVMGAAVNIASGIQQLTRKYPHDILVGEETAARLSGETAHLDTVKIKRLQQDVKVFAVKK